MNAPARISVLLVAVAISVLLWIGFVALCVKAATAFGWLP